MQAKTIVEAGRKAFSKRAAEESTAKAAAAKDPTKEAADKNKAVEKLSAENSS